MRRQFTAWLQHRKLATRFSVPLIPNTQDVAKNKKANVKWPLPIYIYLGLLTDWHNLLMIHFPSRETEFSEVPAYTPLKWLDPDLVLLSR